jgi:hypothetical protein
MVEQMEDRINSEVDTFRSDLTGVRTEVGNALEAISDLLDMESGANGSQGGLAARLQKMQTSLDMLQLGFTNSSASAQARTACLRRRRRHISGCSVTS